MKFCKRLYLGESVEKSHRRIVFKLKHRIGQVDVYVITLPLNGGDLLEIYHCAILKQKYYKNKPFFVVGIAGGKQEAMELSCKMVEELYTMTDGFDMRSFIMEKHGRNRD